MGIVCVKKLQCEAFEYINVYGVRFLCVFLTFIQMNWNGMPPPFLKLQDIIKFYT